MIWETFGAHDIVFRRNGTVDANGSENLDVIQSGNRMFEPLSYPILFPHETDGFHSKHSHYDSKRKRQKFAPMKVYCRLF